MQSKGEGSARVLFTLLMTNNTLQQTLQPSLRLVGFMLNVSKSEQQCNELVHDGHLSGGCEHDTERIEGHISDISVLRPASMCCES